MEDQAQFLRDILSLRRQPAFGFSGGAWMIALASGLARTGRSTLARNLASVFSRKGYRVFLVDGEDGAGLEEILAARAAWRPSGDGQGTDPAAPSGDLVIVDLPAGVSSLALRVLAAADEALVLALPGARGIRDAAGLVNLLDSSVDEVRLAVNCASSLAEGRDTALSVMKARAPGEKTPFVEYRGCVFAHPRGAGPGARPDEAPIVDTDPGSRTSISIVQLAERLERGRRMRIVPGGHDNYVRFVSELDGDSGFRLL